MAASNDQALTREALSGPALTVAESLLGCRLCRRIGESELKWVITEVEAYDGPEDKACHARAGRTSRTEIMFGPAGNWYIYLCYGIHWLLNIVVGPEDYPAAVLIRGAGAVEGPGRLTKALQVNGELNRKPALPHSGLWLEHGQAASTQIIARTPRIGVDYAGPDWSQRPYRFVLKDR